jgi:hypothetical protein
MNFMVDESLQHLLDKCYHFGSFLSLVDSMIRCERL